MTGLCISVILGYNAHSKLHHNCAHDLSALDETRIPAVAGVRPNGSGIWYVVPRTRMQIHSKDQEIRAFKRKHTSITAHNSTLPPQRLSLDDAQRPFEHDDPLPLQHLPVSEPSAHRCWGVLLCIHAQPERDVVRVALVSSKGYHVSSLMLLVSAKLDRERTGSV
jgi:hypothetical protein